MEIPSPKVGEPSPGLVEGLLAPPTLPSAVEAILWDLDATIIDTESLLDKCIREALESVSAQVLGREAAHVDAALDASRGASDRGGAMSWPTIVLTRLGVTDTDEERLLAATYKLFDAALPTATMMPGAMAALAAVPASIPLIIVTSSSAVQVELKRSYFPAVFERMRCVIAVDDVAPYSKPHGMPYALGALRLGVDITRCIVVEDSVPGSTSAVAAGAFALAVPTPHQRDEVRAIVGARGVVVDSLAAVDFSAFTALPASGKADTCGRCGCGVEASVASWRRHLIQGLEDSCKPL
jgi:beta-phosphoglucomutase-like phosphatase (HAD superfamily)